MAFKPFVAATALGFLLIGSIGKADPLQLGDAELDTVTAGQLDLTELFGGGSTSGQLPGINLGDLLDLLPDLDGVIGGGSSGGGGGGTPPDTSTPPIDQGDTRPTRPERPSSLDRSRSRNRASLETESTQPAPVTDGPALFARFAAVASPEIVSLVRNARQTGNSDFEQLFVVLEGNGSFASAGVSASSNS